MRSRVEVLDATAGSESSASARLMLAMIVAVVLMQVELAYAKSINWDEFFHFSEIHRHLQGRPLSWLQVPYVWLFAWVPMLPGENISHIQLIRILILPFEVLTIGAIVATARNFASREASLLCGLVYATGGYVFLHAFALRGDMIAASFLTLALWIGICRPLRKPEIAVLILLVLLAFVATIKSVLYAPAFAGVAFYRLKTPLQRLILAGAAVLIAVAGLLLVWIAPNLPTDGAAGLLHDLGMLGRDSMHRMFSSGLLPQPRWIREQVLRAPLLAFFFLLALVLLAFRRYGTPAERILFLGLLLPACTVVIYRNTFPYHFVFILPPAMIALAPVMGELQRRRAHVPLGVVLLTSAAILSGTQDRKVLQRQRLIEAGIRSIFPSPVTYIDDCGMMGDFPRAVNQFASGWAMANYRRDGKPIYSIAMKSEAVPMLLANNSLLLGQFFDMGVGGALLPEDRQMLGGHFIHHWGKVFVAGKRFQPGSGTEAFEIVAPGIYTVEGETVIIDGTRHAPGDVVELSRGVHFASGDRPTTATLRWGKHLARPSFSWPDDPVFTEY